MTVPTGAAVLRPRDGDALRGELRHLASAGGPPVLFGGEVRDDVLLLSEFVGTRTGLLRGLLVAPNTGLGGATMVAARPLAVSDYRSASSITHDYDTPVLSEGIRSILAVPVVVSGVTRAVLYGGYRSAAPIGGQAADLLVASARRLADELRIRDEVDRRVRFREARQVTTAGAESVREVHADLRRLAADADPEMRAKLLRLAGRLCGDGDSGPAPALTVRELDVLTQVALGCTNAEVADRLSLRTETVKSYLRSAATKLGTHTRYEAVSRARRQGLIP